MTDTPLPFIGRYRILSELGRGAMGVVYKAQDEQLARTVAIKTIRISADADEAGEYLARFRQEAKAVGGLNHPGIITVFDAGRENDIAYMAMEVLEGVELRDLMSQSRLPLALIVDLAAQIAEALAFAHERGVVHRDIKPGNIMVLAGNRTKIMDFGIARVRVSELKTQTGMLLGSPKYMSPEQVLGRGIDQRSDIFSLGTMLYEMLVGITPFSGADLNQLMFQVVNGELAPPSRSNPLVPADLDAIVAKALEKNPDNRYQDAGEMARDLRRCKETLEEAPSPAMAATQTLERTLPLADPPSGFTLSRRFDSARALSRLASLSDSDRAMLSSSPPIQGAMDRLRRDRHAAKMLAIVGGAALIALLITFI
jgi:eukaryotic-like serine/threonine-protein kinase